MNNKDGNFYEKKSINSIETVVLAEDVNFTSFKPTKAKFYLPVMEPTVDQSSASKRLKPQPSAAGRVGHLDTSSYTNSNYLELEIPSFVLQSYVKAEPVEINGHWVMGLPSGSFKIPKDTQMLIEYLGGDTKTSRIKIIGVHDTDSNDEYKARKGG